MADITIGLLTANVESDVARVNHIEPMANVNFVGSQEYNRIAQFNVEL